MSALKNEKGITLVEIMVSIGILALMLLPVMSVFTASIINNRLTQTSMDAKYMAERYMEAVKDAEMTRNGLERALGGEFVYEDTAAAPVDMDAPLIAPGAYVNSENGIRVDWRIVDLLTYSNVSDFTDFDLTNIPETDKHINVEASLNNSYTPPKIALSVGAPYGTRAITISTDEKVRLLFNTELEITIKNTTGTKLEFYCNNPTPDDDVDMPIFHITEGHVAFYDYTEPEDRLNAETKLLPSDTAMPIFYEITVTAPPEGFNAPWASAAVNGSMYQNVYTDKYGNVVGGYRIVGSKAVY